MRRLRGMTWDHPRGYQPLAENVARFAAAHPDIEVSWSRRSLRDFGVQPVEVLAERYDLIVIDHPFCGRARATGCLRDLRPLFPAAFFAMLGRESVGPAARSYHYGGGIWGLPTDAACQVASYRPDLLEGWARRRRGPPARCWRWAGRRGGRASGWRCRRWRATRPASSRRWRPTSGGRSARWTRCCCRSMCSRRCWIISGR